MGGYSAQRLLQMPPCPLPSLPALHPPCSFGLPPSDSFKHPAGWPQAALRLAAPPRPEHAHPLVAGGSPLLLKTDGGSGWRGQLRCRGVHSGAAGLAPGGRSMSGEEQEAANKSRWEVQRGHGAKCAGAAQPASPPLLHSPFLLSSLGPPPPPRPAQRCHGGRSEAGRRHPHRVLRGAACKHAARGDARLGSVEPACLPACAASGPPACATSRGRSPATPPAATTRLHPAALPPPPPFQVAPRVATEAPDKLPAGSPPVRHSKQWRACGRVGRDTRDDDVAAARWPPGSSPHGHVCFPRERCCAVRSRLKCPPPAAGQPTWLCCCLGCPGGHLHQHSINCPASPRCCRRASLATPSPPVPPRRTLARWAACERPACPCSPCCLLAWGRPRALPHCAGPTHARSLALSLTPPIAHVTSRARSATILGTCRRPPPPDQSSPRSVGSGVGQSISRSKLWRRGDADTACAPLLNRRPVHLATRPPPSLPPPSARWAPRLRPALPPTCPWRCPSQASRSSGHWSRGQAEQTPAAWQPRRHVLQVCRRLCSLLRARAVLLVELLEQRGGGKAAAAAVGAAQHCCTC